MKIEYIKLKRIYFYGLLLHTQSMCIKNKKKKIMVPDISIVLCKIMCILKSPILQNDGASIFKSTRFCTPIKREHFTCIIKNYIE